MFIAQILLAIQGYGEEPVLGCGPCNELYVLEDC